jgi:hypothetical protein
VGDQSPANPVALVSRSDGNPRDLEDGILALLGDGDAQQVVGGMGDMHGSIPLLRSGQETNELGGIRAAHRPCQNLGEAGRVYLRWGSGPHR